ncbi:hypothetical protein TNCV_1148731 [Trichonephila clavipes]|nr:hypothetical protein TNCV_1148731 [Trichonephila clavipes]
MNSLFPKEFSVVLVVLQLVPLVLYETLKAIVLSFVPRRFKPKKDITGQNILITGAGSGIGRLLAIEFSKHAVCVVMLDLNKSSLIETEKLLHPSTRTFIYECDVSDRNQVYKVAKSIKEEVGKIDILVNNAGIVSGKGILNIPDEKIVKTVEVNSLAHFWVSNYYTYNMLLLLTPLDRQRSDRGPRNSSWQRAK